MSTDLATLADLAGTDLGSHTARYDDTAAILYALAVGAAEDQLDLVYERDLRTLPSMACALGLWAVEAAGRLGAYDATKSLHISQQLVMHGPMPRSGEIPMTAKVAAVYDKGKAALVEIAVESELFSLTYGIFLPGMGGWGGDRGPSAARGEAPEFTHHTDYPTSTALAALYRLTGDRHPVHIDPELAASNGFERPILHGLCTAGITARVIAEQVGAHPAELTELSFRLSAPVLPGDTLRISSGGEPADVQFTTAVGDHTVLAAGSARFGTRA